MSLKLKCPICGKEFSSIMLYDLHLKKNSEEAFLTLFKTILQMEMASRNQPTLQVVLDTTVNPRLDTIQRVKPKSSQKEKRKNPKLVKHKLVKKKGKKD